MKKRFLVVDDQFLIRCFIKDFLNHFDLGCVEAENGHEAIEKWEKEEFLGILMDIEMPVMDGLRATTIIREREIEENRTYTPIYAISGCSFQAPEKKCKEAGMDGFLAKPMGIDKLLEIVMPLVRPDESSNSKDEVD